MYTHPACQLASCGTLRQAGSLLRVPARGPTAPPWEQHQVIQHNTTSCQHPEAGWLTATCPSARPYCATVGTAPDFASSLGCARAATAPCSLTNSPRQTLELTCTCIGHLCNAPFSNKLRNELNNFSSSTNDSTLTEVFFKLSNFANVSESALYKAITVATDVSGNSTVPTLTSSDGSLSALPRAEALKQQTVPSDDDEDENEGSGAYEDSRLRLQSQSASAPAAPSSFLPAEQNKASALIAVFMLPFAFIITTI
ncbi:Uncharacterized protein OBRU01_15289 [Operophtera brumata]|uniref:Uncharacterized protein n=1 Tax=Operophtera brumata TaxID=104452 RepID=A0A0L7KRV0_OPEBR|nr:Uncharacterized protein OBRU01_15289 [Operophtera brumata]